MEVTCRIRGIGSGEWIDIKLVDIDIGYEESRNVYEAHTLNFISYFSFENRIKRTKSEMHKRYTAIKRGMDFDANKDKSIKLVSVEGD